MNKVTLSMLSMASIFFLSCSDDDNTGGGIQVPDVVIETPETYSFEREGSSTVSYSGQTTRIQMAEQLISSLSNTESTKEELHAMFDHQEGNEDFDDATLNASDKNIKSKTANSQDYFKSNADVRAVLLEKFDAWIDNQVDVVFPNWDVDAVAGTAGMIQEAGGGSTRRVNGKGLEYNQAFAKSLIGGLMVDQILNNYLSVSVLDAETNVDDNNEGTLAEGKTYTNMEHKWDEAFGYLYGTDSATEPALGADSFLNKYLDRVEGDDDFAGIADDIYNAFLLGRAAIVAKQYDIRNQQAAIIRDAISKIIAVRAVYYLQAGKDNIEKSDMASAFHDLSEGFGFIQSLRFTRDSSTDKPHVTSEKVEEYLTTLMDGDGFWTVTAATLDTISEEIATAYGITVEQAK